MRITITFLLVALFVATKAQYTLTDDDVVVVDGVIDEYTGTATEIIIPETLDGQTVYTVGRSAFADKSLTSVIMANSIVHLETSAFQRNELTHVTLSESLTEIDWYVFRENQIESIELPVTLELLDRGAFQGNALTEVSIPANLTEIGPDAFDENLITSINFHDAVTTIGNGAFSDNELSSVTIPNSVTTIGTAAFARNNISTLDLGNAVESIGVSAFQTNSLTSVIFPNSLREIGNQAFGSNDGLGSFVLPINPDPSFVNWERSNGTFVAGGATVNEVEVAYTAKFVYTLTDDDVEVEDGIITSCTRPPYVDIIIPDILDGQEITGIGNGVFHGDRLESVVFPDALTTVGDQAFLSNNLTELNLPAGLTTIGERAFDGSRLTELTIPGNVLSIGRSAFSGNDIVDLTLPQGLIKIELNAFAYNEMEELNIPNTVTHIGSGAFYRNKLTSVTLPNSVLYIGINAFQDNELVSFDLPTPGHSGFVHWYDVDNNTYSGGSTVSNLEIDYSARTNYTLTDDDVVVEDGVIVSYSKTNEHFIIIPDELDGQAITEIGENAFEGNCLTGVVLPSGLEIIREYAFSDNDLITISLPYGVSRIETRAFGDNHIRNPVEFPTTMEYIASYIFRNNYGFDDYILPDSDSSTFIFWLQNSTPYNPTDTVRESATYRAIYSYVLTDDDVEVVDGVITSYVYDADRRYITIPTILDGQTVTGIGYLAFANKSLGHVVLPGTLERIERLAFFGNNLFELTIPENVIYIGGGAFNNNSIGILDGQTCRCMIYARSEQGIDSTTVVSYADSWPWLDVLPGQILHIGDDAFRETEISRVVLPDSLRTIGNYAFYFNQLNNEMIIPEKVSRIGSEAFRSNDIPGVVLPDSLEYIGASAFQYNEITEVIMPHTVTYLGWSAFANNRITNLSLSENLKVINREAFANNLIPAVTLPDAIEQVNSSAFQTNRIEVLTLTNNVGEIQSRAFAYNRITELILPDNGLALGNQAFLSNEIATLDLPLSVDLEGYGIFNDNAIVEINDLASDGIVYHQMNGVVDDQTIVSYGGTANEVDFIAAGVDTIAEESFSHNDLNGVTIPHSVYFIGERAFSSNDLTSIVLPTPSASNFLYWEDSDLNTYEAGSEVTDLYSSYAVILDDAVAVKPNVSGEVEIYPNPFDRKLKVEAKVAVKIEIYDAIGDLIYENNAPTNEHHINLDAFESGVYFMKTISKDGESFDKIVKE